MLTPHDIRQFRRMLECISAMRSKSVPILEGADCLLFLRDALEASSQEWSDVFTSQLATLESTGTASTEQRFLMGSRFDVLVVDTLSSLEKLIWSSFPDGIIPTEHDEEEDL